jgi:prolyl-tRNA editing enzyme YbaK/EbsC (Cys-tRNA(Pro) deacylase)
MKFVIVTSKRLAQAAYTIATGAVAARRAVELAAAVNRRSTGSVVSFQMRVPRQLALGICSTVTTATAPSAPCTSISSPGSSHAGGRTAKVAIVPLMPEPPERRVLAALDALGAAYEEIRIDPEHAATKTFCERYGYAMEASGNCIVVASKKGARRHCACVVQATRRLDVNGTVRRLLETRKASFAPPEETEALTGMLPDGVTPFGLPEELPVYVDAPIAELDRVIVGGGSRSLKLLVDPEVFRRMPQASIVVGLSIS